MLLRDDSWVKGYVAAIDDDSFAVMEKKARTIRTIAYSDVVSVSGPASKKQIALPSVAGIVMIGVVVAAVYVASFRGFSCDSLPSPVGRPGGTCTNVRGKNAAVVAANKAPFPCRFFSVAPVLSRSRTGKEGWAVNHRHDSP